MKTRKTRDILVNDEEPVVDPVDNLDEARTPADNLEEEISLPEKYRGKSVEEVAKMHIEAERALSNKANELGDLRKLTDEVIRRQLSGAAKEAAPAPAASRREISTDDILNRPDESINEAIASHPAIKRAEDLERQLLERDIADKHAAFEKRHPDYKEMGNSPEFLEWIKASSMRTKLFQHASTQFDFDVADELLATFKELNKGKQVVAAKELRNKEIRAKGRDATLETSTTGDSSKKVFRRRDLLDMMIRDPDSYYADGFQVELQRAYQEGRVK